MQLRLMNIDLRYNYKKASYLWCSNNNLRYSPGNRGVVNVQVKSICHPITISHRNEECLLIRWVENISSKHDGNQVNDT